MEVYTPEQQKDIAERIEKAKKVLDDLQLGVFANTQSVSIAPNVFALQVTPFLGDLKFIEPQTTQGKVDKLLKTAPKVK